MSSHCIYLASLFLEENRFRFWVAKPEPEPKPISYKKKPTRPHPHPTLFFFSLVFFFLADQPLTKPQPHLSLVLHPSPPRALLTMTKQAANWSPYDNNGGSCVAIAGADYCVIAADTRMSTGYSILSRDYSKICKLADKSLMASSGFQADVKALQKFLAARHLTYQHQHNKQMSCPAMAQLLSNTLYYKRFFPYYSFNVLGGLDNEGKGCVYTYDAVGSYERVGYGCQGSGSTLIMPFLDNQLKSPSPLLLPAQDAVTPLSESEAVDLVKTCFASATERDIYTGDRLEIVILNADGIHRQYMELRKD